MKIQIKKSPLVLLFFLFVAVSVSAESDSSRIVFQERRIEGKIRRPQLVLISADQRPDMVSVLLFSGYTSKDMGISEELFKLPHQSSFQFSGTDVINPKP